MSQVRVRDLKGRHWVVTRSFAPWWRVVQPVALLTQRYRRRKVVPPGRHRVAPRRRFARKKEFEPGHWENLGTNVLIFVAFVLSLPEILLAAVFWVLVALLLTPFALLEMLAQVLAGCAVWLARVAGSARWRVAVVGREEFEVHSLTVLLVRGRRAAAELVEALAAERAASARRFVPDELPLLGDAKAAVVSHVSAW